MFLSSEQKAYSCCCMLLFFVYCMGVPAAFYLQLFKNCALNAAFAIECKFYNKWHNLFDTLKITEAPLAVGVVVYYCRKGSAVTANGYVVAGVFFYNLVYGTNISLLHFTNTFAARQFVCKIAPLIAGVFVEAVKPFVADGAFS